MKALLSVSLLFLVTSCASLIKERPVKLQKELAADHFSDLGDKARMNRDYKTALIQYNKASDIYIFKLNKKKWAINELKKVLVYSWQKKYKSAQRVFDRIKLINGQEALGLDIELSAVDLQTKIQKGKSPKDYLRVQQIKKSLKNDFPRWTYYHFLALQHWPEKYSSADLTECRKMIDELLELYDDGDLVNLEPLIYGGLVLAQTYVKRESPQAFEAIKKAELVYKEQELTGRIDDIFRLYISFYQQKGNKDMIGLYQQFLGRYKKSGL